MECRNGRENNDAQPLESNTRDRLPGGVEGAEDLLEVLREVVEQQRGKLLRRVDENWELEVGLRRHL